MQYDYVVVGAGTAGCLLASRLSENGKYTVCLLEAGPWDRNLHIQIPAGFVRVLFDPRFTWQFQTEPVAGVGGRKFRLPQGRVIGGTSAINGMVYCRGASGDFDAWACAGNVGWSFKEVLPYFRRIERFREGGDPLYRGRDGMLPITECDLRHPLCDAFVETAEELGIPRNPDYNAERQSGAGYYQRWINRGWRVSSAAAFLRPVMKRRNLNVLASCRVTGVMIEQNRAIGVKFKRGSSPADQEVRARREVILSAGALNTPHILQVSGIGNERNLREAGIGVIHVLPGVGENLADHYMIRVIARVSGIRTFNESVSGWRFVAQLLRWLAGKPSIISTSPSLAYAFCNTDAGPDEPDLQLMFTPASFLGSIPGELDSFPGMTLGFYQLRPKSLGWVRARNPDPLSVPRIQPNYLDDAEDREVTVRGVKLVRKVLQSGSLKKYFRAEIKPGNNVRTDEEVLEFARQHGNTGYHPIGTCKMGPPADPMAVVDNRLRVRGLTCLRVVDASVIPAMLSGNPGATVMMIAEKGADMILADAADLTSGVEHPPEERAAAARNPTSLRGI